MRTLHAFAASVAVTLLASAAGAPAHAQGAPPIARADAAALVGWLAASSGSAGPHRGDDWNNNFFGGASVGWYWTDHLKTEVDSGAGTEATAYRVVPRTIDGRPTYESVQTTVTRRVLGIGQQYQFFRNAWFHPHVAAGVTWSWDRRTDYFQPLVVFDDLAGRVVEEARTEGPRTVLTLRPYAAAGFKAYITRRGFFRTDLRVAFRGGIDESLVRLGFGVDF